MPFDYENICTSSLICNKWSITFWCSENNKTMGASTSKRPIMDGRFKMISSNLEGFKFPQLTSVLIASFSLIITIILSPRTWERKQTFTFCLRLHDDLFLSHKSSCMATNVFSASYLSPMMEQFPSLDYNSVSLVMCWDKWLMSPSNCSFSSRKLLFEPWAPVTSDIQMLHSSL